MVDIGDITRMVSVALDEAPVSSCPLGDINADGKITVKEIIIAVGEDLYERARISWLFSGNSCKTLVSLHTDGILHTLGRVRIGVTGESFAGESFAEVTD